ncbi:MAG: hypothetical protein WBC05_06005 [Sedimentisphaerales bacterium]
MTKELVMLFMGYRAIVKGMKFKLKFGIYFAYFLSDGFSFEPSYVRRIKNPAEPDYLQKLGQNPPLCRIRGHYG